MEPSNQILVRYPSAKFNIEIHSTVPTDEACNGLTDGPQFYVMLFAQRMHRHINISLFNKQHPDVSVQM
jgi:hypothetical protein